MNQISRENDVTVIELGPRYDSLDSQALQELEKLILREASHCQPPRLLLDMARTEYIGSSFIEILVRAWRELKKRHGRLAVCAVRPFCAEVLQTTRLDRLWGMYPDRAGGVAALAASGGA